MLTYEEEKADFLAHFGVKGMKWGKRKGSSPDEPKSKSGYRLSIESRYMKKGLSAEKAAKNADRDLKVQKTLLVAGAVTLAAAGTYLATKKLGQEFLGAELKKGTLVQHISKQDYLNLNDGHLYTTYKKLDKLNYQGSFAAELGGLKGVNTHAIKLKTLSDIKAPSNSQGKKLLSEFKRYKTSPEQYDMLVKDFYKSGNPEVESFKKFLLDKGFNAIIDTTDQKAYAQAYKPLIVFDSTRNLVAQGSRFLNRKEIINKYAAVTARQVMTDPLIMGTMATGVGYTSAIMGVKNATVNKKIDAWYKANPTQKLSVEEVSLLLDI